jgi:solute carrier family 25 folate transporter 32
MKITRQRRGSEQLIAGAVSGAIATSVTAPLDLVKTILQNNGGKQTTMTVLKDVVRKEGSMAAFRGLGPSLVGIVPHWAIYFESYDLMKKPLETSGCSPMTASALAAFGAGSISTVATNPIWVVKTRMQALRSNYPKMSNAFKAIYMQEGLRGFYKGMAASLVGVSHVGVQFPLYEKLKSHPYLADMGLSGVMVASSASKMLASAVTYPHEVLRTRMQCQSTNVYRGLAHATSKIVSEEGVKVLYRGMLTNMVRSVPASMITFAVYETVFKELTA